MFYRIVAVSPPTPKPILDNGSRQQQADEIMPANNDQRAPAPFSGALDAFAGVFRTIFLPGQDHHAEYGRDRESAGPATATLVFKQELHALPESDAKDLDILPESKELVHTDHTDSHTMVPDLTPLSKLTRSWKIHTHIESIPREHQSTIRQFFHAMALINLVPELPLLNILPHLSPLSTPMCQATQSLETQHWTNMMPIAREVLSSDTLYDIILGCIQMVQNPSTTKPVKNAIKQAIPALKTIISLLPADPRLLLLWVNLDTLINKPDSKWGKLFKLTTKPDSKTEYPLHHYLYPFAIEIANETDRALLQTRIRPYTENVLLANKSHHWDSLPPVLKQEILRQFTSRPLEQLMSLPEKYLTRIEQGQRYKSNTKDPVMINYFTHLETCTHHRKKPVLSTKESQIKSLSIDHSGIETQIQYNDHHYSPEEFGIELAKLKEASSPIVAHLCTLAAQDPSNSLLLLYKVINAALMYNPTLKAIVPLLNYLKSHEGSSYIQKLLHVAIPDHYSLDHHVLIDFIKDKPEFWVNGIHFRVFEWLATHLTEEELIQNKASIPPIMAHLVPISTQIKMGTTQIPPHRLALAMIMDDSLRSSSFPDTQDPNIMAIKMASPESIQFIKNLLTGSTGIKTPFPDKKTLKDMDTILTLIDPKHQLQYPEHPFLIPPSEAVDSTSFSHPIIKRMCQVKHAEVAKIRWLGFASPPPTVQPQPHPYTAPSFQMKDAIFDFLNQGDHGSLLHIIATNILKNTWDSADIIVAELMRHQLSTTCLIHLLAALATDVLSVYDSESQEYQKIRKILDESITILEQVPFADQLTPLIQALNTLTSTEECVSCIPIPPRQPGVLTRLPRVLRSRVQPYQYQLLTRKKDLSVDELEHAPPDTMIQFSTLAISGGLYRVGNKVIHSKGQRFKGLRFSDNLVHLKNGAAVAFLPIQSTQNERYQQDQSWKISHIYNGRTGMPYYHRTSRPTDDKAIR